MNISVIHIANLFNYASYLEVSESVLRNCLIDKQIDVCNANNTITESEFLNVFKMLMSSTNDKYFGLHYGCFLNIKAMGFISQISLNCSSVTQAVLILQNYFKSSFPLVSIEVKETKDEYLLIIVSKIKNLALKNQILTIAYCFIYRELKLMVINSLLPNLVLPYINNTEYSKFLNVQIKKGKGYFFIFSLAILEEKLNKKTINEIEVLLPKFLQMLDKKKVGYIPFSAQVRNMVLNMCSPELPTFQQVAAHFPMSNRSIQRKLREEGISFRKITAVIKNELSNYLIKGNKIKTQDIAHILGYSEPSAYLHAVKKWKKE